MDTARQVRAMRFSADVRQWQGCDGDGMAADGGSGSIVSARHVVESGTGGLSGAVYSGDGAFEGGGEEGAGGRGAAGVAGFQ